MQELGSGSHSPLYSNKRNALIRHIWPIVLGSASKESVTVRGKPTMNTFLLKLYVRFQDLASREEGQEMVEYALVVALISFGGITGMTALAGALNKAFAQISTTLGSYAT